ncbi:uncharacterized protein MONBRDRAFT_23174 [Monosiga brevicollis MX1]|uniref:Uncharacterized protein n=1 Tax=Monosiga brevicollis TaxID=81824 RepID=A9URE4_MONBE|nr:uncharacterized protein MONBRDRAFT_23174 [Monosiga brevicollis MX1]EDQ91908.1 predicted protein [Monosiga brevicollis MX1]|eukprot:XP_001743194.1 hypothetical protein [Monosiga brevicollis MX1]
MQANGNDPFFSDKMTETRCVCVCVCVCVCGAGRRGREAREEREGREERRFSSRERDSRSRSMQERLSYRDDDRRRPGRNEEDRERDDGQEQERPRDPQRVPRRGYFYDHDDRARGRFHGRREGSNQAPLKLPHLPARCYLLVLTKRVAQLDRRAVCHGHPTTGTCLSHAQCLNDPCAVHTQELQAEAANTAEPTTAGERAAQNDNAKTSPMAESGASPARRGEDE